MHVFQAFPKRERGLVRVIHDPGDFATPGSTTIDPNPVVAELKPAGPPPKAHRPRPKKPKPPPAAVPAAAPAGGSPFPDPNAPAQPSR
jgi:hypothetical protein